MDWTNELDKQLSWHWENALRPRLAGLTDGEYLWEPVPGMWSVRSGRIDFAYPPPTPEPVTTIAWRIGHLLVGVFGERIARHFGGPAISHDSYRYPSTAADALARLDDMYSQWIAGVRSLDDTGLAEPCGKHSAEICLLRDLYRWQN
jgi:hypothetical protein